MGCLNLSNPQVKEWIDNVGFDETYRQYLTHNYTLPKYKAYLQSGAYAGMNREEIKVHLSQLLDPNLYEFEGIEKILGMAPDAQAAFWKNTFYFANKANKLQVNEEAFHAIFQTLTNPADKKALYAIAENLLQERAKKAGKTVQQLIKNYSAFTGLEKEALYKYALEEELAKTFVNWYTYDNQLVAEQSIKVHLSQLLDPSLYEFDVIEKILEMAPGAQAAFWKNTFYFAKKANKLQINEEAFHGIFQTLTNPADKKILYSIAENLLQARAKKAGKTVQQLIKNYSASTVLEKEALYEYALEEELAKTFVNWYTYDNQLIAEQSIKDIWSNKDASLGDKLYDTLVRFFNKLSQLIRGYKDKRPFLETYFSAIKEGKYKLDSPRFTTDAAFPSLSSLEMVSEFNGHVYILDVVEQNIIYSKILSLAHQIKEGVIMMSDKEIMNIAVDAYVTHLDSSLDPLNKTQSDDIAEGFRYHPDDTDVRDVAINDLLGLFLTIEDNDSSVFDQTLNEDGEVAREKQWDEEANTIDHFNSLSKKMKAIMGTIHVISAKDASVTHTFTNISGGEQTLTLRLSRMADPTKIYASVVRTTTNTSSEIEKLRKLLLFASDSNLNTDTKAFVDHTFRTLFGDNVLRAKNLILNRETISIADLVINKNYYLTFMKSFDLWTRPSKIYEFYSEGGEFKSFNPNMTNVKGIQLDKWEKKWRTLKDSYLNEDKVRVRRERIYTDVLFLRINEFGAIEQDETSTARSTESLGMLYESFGVTLSKNYLKYVVAKVYIEKLGLGHLVVDEYRDLYDSFLLEDSEIDDDLNSFANGVQGRDSFDIDEVYLREMDDKRLTGKGFVTRFEKAAMGNAIFDESVLATSYLDADNKRRYAHQVRTHALRFLGSIVKDNKKIKEYQNELRKLSGEADEFIIGNKYYEFIESFSHQEKSRLKFNSYGGAQVKSAITKFIEKQTVNDVTPRDFAILEANIAIDSVTAPRKKRKAIKETDVIEEYNNKTSASYFIGHVEATNTLTMFTGEWFKDTEASKMVDVRTGIKGRKINHRDIIAGNMAVDMAYDLLAQQMARAKLVDAQIKSQLSPSSFTDNKLEFTLNSKTLKNLGFIGDIIEGYHTGKVYYELDENGDIQLDIAQSTANRKSLPRALTITDSLTGYYKDPAIIYNHFFNNTDKKDILEDISLSLNSLLDQAYDLYLNHPYLSSDYKSGSISSKAFNLGFEQTVNSVREDNATFKINIGKFFFNSMFNREHFHRATFGDSAVINKNDIVDQSKRLKAFEGQMLSVRTLLTNKDKGINAPLTEVRHVTELSSANDEKDLNTSGVWDGIDPKNKKVDQDDGQSRSTVQFTRSYLHGLDRLSSDLVYVLDKLQNGTEFTEAEEKHIEKNKLFITVEKSRGAGPQQDIKHAVQVLKKLETSLKHDITDATSLDVLDANITVVDTLSNTNINSYFVVPRDAKGKFKGATREITVEFNRNKHETYEAAFLAGEIRIFEWTPKSLHLHDRRKNMEGWRTINGKEIYNSRYEFDLLSPTTAHKRRTVNVLWDINNLNTDSDFHIQKLDAHYYGRQVENPAKGTISDPTQQLEIITSALSDTVEYMYNGVKQSVNKDVIISHFQKLLAKRDTVNVLDAIEELRDENGETSLVLFYNTIINTLKETGADRQLLESFTIVDGQPVINGNIPFVKTKLEQYLFSHFSNGVLVQKRKGDAKAMISPRGQVLLKKTVRNTTTGLMGWETIPSYTEGYNDLFKEGANNRLEELGLSYNGLSGKAHQNTLQDVIESLGEGVYYIDEYRFNVPVQRGPIVQYFTETVISKYHHKQKTIQDSFRYLTGVKIPSQDKSTTANLMIVDLTDISGGNNISTAKEIQQLSGGDFDRDKLFTTYAEGYWIGNIFKLYDRTFKDYLKYVFSNKRSLKDKFKELSQNNESLIAVTEKIDKIESDLKKYFNVESFIEDQEEIAKIDSIFAELYKQSGDLYNQRDKTIADQDRELYDTIDRKIRIFETKRNLNSGTLDTLKDDRRELLLNLRYVSDQHGEIIDTINNPLKEKRKIIAEIEVEALKALRLPSTDIEFIKIYPNTAKDEETFNGGEYNAIVNNSLLEISYSLLTSNPEGYSNITSVDPLRNIDINSKEKGLGLLAEARALVLAANPDSTELDFDSTPNIPYHSTLFDVYYSRKIKAAKNSIGIVVNVNLSFALLNRLGIRLNENYITHYEEDGITLHFDSFGEYMPNYVNQAPLTFRSSWISSLISVTTDEAKEGILAKYNLQGGAITIFSVGLELGMHPELLVALVNNKLIQSLVNYSERDPLATKQKDSLLALVNGHLFAYTIELKANDPKDRVLTRKKLINGLLNESTNNYTILQTVRKLLIVAEQHSDTVKVMRVKKGLKPTYSELMNLVVSVKKLGLGSPNVYMQYHYPTVKVNEIHKAYNLEEHINNSNIKQFSNYIDVILPDIYETVGGVLIDGTKTYKNAYNYAIANLRLHPSQLKAFEKEYFNAFLGYVINQVNKNPVLEAGEVFDAKIHRQMDHKINPNVRDIVGEFTLAKEFEAIMLDPFLRSRIATSPLFSRLLSMTAEAKLSKQRQAQAIDTISLHIFSNLSPEMQSDLMDDYSTLQSSFTKEGVTEHPRIVDFLTRLLSYYAGKDALGYSPVSISKIFSPVYFTDISNYLDYILKEQPVSDEISEYIFTRFATDIRNIKFLPHLPSTKKGDIKIKYTHSGNVVIVEYPGYTVAPAYHRYSSGSLMRNNSILRHVLESGGKQYYIEYPSLGHKDYVSSIAGGRFTFQSVRKNAIIKALSIPKLPVGFPPSMEGIIAEHVASLGRIEEANISSSEDVRHKISNILSIQKLYALYISLSRVQQKAATTEIRNKRKYIGDKVFFPTDITPVDSSTPVGTYLIRNSVGQPTALAEDEVLVFGTNDSGTHSRGEAKDKENKWSVEGEHSKISEGKKGKSYGLVLAYGGLGSKDMNERSTPDILQPNIAKLYADAKANPTLTFKVDYTTDNPTRPHHNGYSPIELAVLFSSTPIPTNVIFDESFGQFINAFRGLEHLNLSTEPVAEKDDGN